MTKSVTRRDFFKSAALAAVAATVTPAWEPFASAEETLRGKAEALGVSDLQLDLEGAIERHKVAGANAAIYHNGPVGEHAFAIALSGDNGGSGVSS